MYNFEQITLDTLSNSVPSTLDDLPFGVIGLSSDGLVKTYNATESRLAGLPVSRVLGMNFFDHIAQCMNNFMVAQRFLDDVELDITLDFVLTLRMRPTPVKLRLLQSKAEPFHFVLVHRIK